MDFLVFGYLLLLWKAGESFVVGNSFCDGCRRHDNSFYYPPLIANTMQQVVWSSDVTTSAYSVSNHNTLPSEVKTGPIIFSRNHNIFGSVKRRIQGRKQTRLFSHRGDSHDGNDNDHRSVLEQHQHNHHDGDIVVTAEIDIPVPSNVAYEAFNDMKRQSTYSSWLKKVEYVDNNNEQQQINKVGTKTKWTMSYMGMPFTWKAISTNNIPNQLIEWKSITGLKNNGKVEFYEEYDNNNNTPITNMRMTMTFTPPKIATRLLGFRKGSKKFGKIIEDKMLKSTLEQFKQIVLEKDWIQYQQQKQKLIEKVAEANNNYNNNKRKNNDNVHEYDKLEDLVYTVPVSQSVIEREFEPVIPQ